MILPTRTGTPASHWLHDVNPARSSRTPLHGHRAYDVAIVGGGYTGLWAAHYLLRNAPGTRIAILEAHHVGAGASGRNGGWLSHLVPGNRSVYAHQAGKDRTLALQRLMIEAVEEVLSEAASLNLAIDAVQGGNLVVASTPAELHRLKARCRADREFGLTDVECRLVSASEAKQRINVHGAIGGLYYPTVARIHPAKLVDGLATAVEDAGVRIFERSPAVTVSPGRLTTPTGSVEADHVLVCTEGYGGALLGKRQVIPINSSMIVTPPLSQDAWQHIGWENRECFSDAAHTFVYAQRTQDDRIAIGGRGNPYRFASNTNLKGRTPASTTRALLARLADYFPDIHLTADSSWSGVLGVTRDWCAKITHDPRGLTAAYGYAGHGVTSANLAARAMVDLTLNRATELTRIPLVGHRSPRWEPEPLRWLGVHTMYHLFETADAWERQRQQQRTSLLARFGARLAGLDGQ
ncbi:FAD-dependent oxidoreductase [Nocardioides sp. NPDC004968]|uniref:NAD(P)/FAD-dependent oxidoreductase n=1 Tax=Nocardioides sp. NPDC004968 TaxID=3155894 RepID=UPI0033A12F5C